VARANFAFSLFLQTRLQGTSLDGADLTGALLQNSCVWGTTGRPKLDLVEIQDLDETSVPWESGYKQSFEHWVAYNSGDINDRLYQLLKKRLADLDPANSSRRPAIDSSSWKDAIAAQSKEQFAEKIANRLLNFVCDQPASSLGTLQNRIGRSNIIDQPALLAELNRRRKEKSCSGLSSMKEQDWFDLETIMQLRISNAGKSPVDWGNKYDCVR
jgi:hypothetical protein